MRLAGTFLLACLTLAAVPAGAGDPPADPVAAGTALAQRVYDRPDGRDLVTRGTMVLTAPRSRPRVRRMYTYRLDRGDGRVLSLVRFTAPEDIAGVGLLTVDHPGEATDQWLFLPALGKVRRIAGERKGGRFVGSDLYYEDLRDREPDMDRHRLLRREKFQGVLCEVLESVPADPANSVYGRRVSWIHPQTLVALRVDFYPKRGKEPLKRLVVHRIQRIQGYWTVMDSTMTELRSGHRTRMTVEKAVYDQGLPESLFTRQALEDESRERRYRP